MLMYFVGKCCCVGCFLESAAKVRHFFEMCKFLLVRIDVVLAEKIFSSVGGVPTQAGARPDAGRSEGRRSTLGRATQHAASADAPACIQPPDNQAQNPMLFRRFSVRVLSLNFSVAVRTSSTSMRW